MGAPAQPAAWHGQQIRARYPGAGHGADRAGHARGSADDNMDGVPMSMTKDAFLNRLRSLHNIDGDMLPELSAAQQLQFVRDPVRYLIGAYPLQSDAIWREIERRQTPVEQWRENVKAYGEALNVDDDELESGVALTKTIDEVIAEDAPSNNNDGEIERRQK